MNNFFDFIRRYHKPGRPVLLGFSGGPDSLALCHLLIESGVDLHLAHVDHGWREESALEADSLAAYAKELGVPFYVRRLQKKCGELQARQERLLFFAELYAEKKFQALVLGHHADDQAETILKRVFEGSSFFSWDGIRERAQIEGIEVWRPLLRVSKESICNLLKEKELIPIEDITNQDTRYLRARMRKDLFPMLSEAFGKEVRSNVLRVGAHAQELREYFSFRLQGLLDSVQRGVMGSYLEVPEGMHPVELKALIKLWLVEGEKKALSYEAIQLLVDHVVMRRADKQIMGVFVDRGCIFVPVPVSFSVHIEPNAVSTLEVCSWKDIWKGTGKIILPKGVYDVIPHPGGRSMGKLWCAHKVPAFIRQVIPVVLQGEKVCGEFLSGRQQRILEGGRICISLTVNSVYK